MLFVEGAVPASLAHGKLLSSLWTVSEPTRKTAMR